MPNPHDFQEILLTSEDHFKTLGVERQEVLSALVLMEAELDACINQRRDRVTNQAPYVDDVFASLQRRLMTLREHGFTDLADRWYPMAEDFNIHAGRDPQFLLGELRATKRAFQAIVGDAPPGNPPGSMSGSLRSFIREHRNRVTGQLNLSSGEQIALTSLVRTDMEQLTQSQQTVLYAAARYGKQIEDPSLRGFQDFQTLMALGIATLAAVTLHPLIIGAALGSTLSALKASFRGPTTPTQIFGDMAAHNPGMQTGSRDEDPVRVGLAPRRTLDRGGR